MIIYTVNTNIYIYLTGISQHQVFWYACTDYQSPRFPKVRFDQVIGQVQGIHELSNHTIVPTIEIISMHSKYRNKQSIYK